jgi:hypothetical protein
MAVATAAVATVVDVTTRDEGEEEEEDVDEAVVVMFPANDEVGYGEQKPAFSTNYTWWGTSNIRFHCVLVHKRNKAHLISQCFRDQKL